MKHWLSVTHELQMPTRPGDILEQTYKAYCRCICGWNEVLTYIKMTSQEAEKAAIAKHEPQMGMNDTWESPWPSAMAPIGRVAETTKMHDIPVPKREHRIEIGPLPYGEEGVLLYCICGWSEKSSWGLCLDEMQPFLNRHIAWYREQVRIQDELKAADEDRIWFVYGMDTQSYPLFWSKDKAKATEYMAKLGYTTWLKHWKDGEEFGAWGPDDE